MPFLKSVWYVAGFAADLNDKPISRRICDELIVIYRGADGRAIALEDRCPHRFVPLSAGVVEGCAIRCAYHGLLFGPDGACVERPHDDGPMPERLKVKPYPVIERHGVIWMWFGAPEAANPDTIPDFSFIADTERFQTVRGYLKIEGNYELISDNLLDLSHVHYLHPQIKPEDGFDTFENTVVHEDGTIWSKLWKPSYTPGVFQRSIWGSSATKADGRSDVRWNAPASLLATTAVAEVGQPIDEGVQMPNAHLITPETEYTSHYFWAVGRSVRRNDAELDEQLRKVVSAVFSTQDRPIIEAQQRAMGESTDFLSQRPVILKADAAGVLARRVMKRMIQEEQAMEANKPVAAE
jgi:vanillate O-demethylase monooxygenase subunit